MFHLSPRTRHPEAGTSVHWLPLPLFPPQYCLTSVQPRGLDGEPGRTRGIMQKGAWWFREPFCWRLTPQSFLLFPSKGKASVPAKPDSICQLQGKGAYGGQLADSPPSPSPQQLYLSVRDTWEREADTAFGCRSSA